MTTTGFFALNGGIKYDETQEISMSSPEEIFDPIARPKHYASHPSGLDCIVIAEHMNFCVGNAIKYLWRAGLKGSHLEDLKKARWYVDREIARLEKRS
jgi:hypothetical protein